MTVTHVISTFLDVLLYAAFLIAVLCIAAAVEMVAICGLVNYYEWRDRRQQARRPGYITDAITEAADHGIVGSPWRNQ